jgi:hypothetical protein
MNGGAVRTDGEAVRMYAGVECTHGGTECTNAGAECMDGASDRTYADAVRTDLVAERMNRSAANLIL